ncbi:MAG: hypothetical protein ACFB9M_02675 [Myxococcota bacterium]
MQWPHELIASGSEWARVCFPRHSVIGYFIADTTLVVGLLWVHTSAFSALYRTLQRQSGEESATAHHRAFAWAMCFVAASIDVLENLMLLLKSYAIPSIHAIKLAVYGGIWLWLLGLGVVWAGRALDPSSSGNPNSVEDFSFLKKHLGYFYPPAFYIFMVVVLFNSFDQFDSLFIEAVDGFSFIFFTLVMTMSVVIVWFVPYYLWFTGRLLGKYFFVAAPDPSALKAADIPKTMKAPPTRRQLVSWEVAIFPVHLVLDAPARYDVLKEHWKAIDSDGAELSERHEAWLHWTRRSIAILFIFSLIWLLSSIAWDGGLLVPPMLVPGFVALLLIPYIWWIESAIGSKPSEHNEPQMLALLIVPFVLLAALWLFTIFFNGSWMIRHLSFIGAASASVFAFVAFARYRRIDARHQIQKCCAAKFFHWIYVVRHGITAVLMWLGLVLPAAMLIVAFFCSLWDITALTWINPINFFLVYVNGLVALIALVQRASSLYVARAGLTGDPETARMAVQRRRRSVQRLGTAFAACVLAYYAATRSLDSGYHDVAYLAEKPSPRPNLHDFTLGFLKRNPKGPIYFVAAEGGGLRAATWTMHVLAELDEKTNGAFSKHTFMMSGASGGGIGQGMYTYLLSQGRGTKLVQSKISKLASSNFLTGDLAGIGGKATIASLFPFVSMSGMENRPEAMARSYFTVAGVQNYKTFRSQSFSSLWERSGAASADLPLLFVNATRAEDGRRGIVHPLEPGFAESLGFIDLVARPKDPQTEEKEWISYPDALFLTNRFPVASPAGDIRSRGHYVDGGYLENSGLQTVLQVLLQIHAGATEPGRNGDTFREVLSRRLVVVSIGNSRETFIDRYFHQMAEAGWRTLDNSELGSIVSAAATGGTTALPIFYRQRLGNSALREALCMHDFREIVLPYRVENEDVHAFHKVELATCGLDCCLFGKNAPACDATDYHANQCFKSTPGEAGMNAMITRTLEEDPAFPEIPLLGRLGQYPVPDPPLGRIIAKPIRQYMKRMLRHPETKGVVSEIKAEMSQSTTSTKACRAVERHF